MGHPSELGLRVFSQDAEGGVEELIFFVVFFFVVVVDVVVAFVAGAEAAGAAVGEGTFGAVLVIVAAGVFGGEFFAFRSNFGGGNGAGFVEVAFAVDELRGDPESFEQKGGFGEIEMAEEDGFVDAGDGELDGGGIFRDGQHKRPELLVNGDDVGFGVEVAKVTAFERWGFAAESVGLDVPAFHVHGGVSPVVLFSSKFVIPGGLGSEVCLVSG